MMKIKINLRNMAAIAACLAVIVLFASCTKRSDVFSNSDVNVIKADNINGSENVVKIQACVSETQWSKQIVAESFFKNNGFKLNLPSVLSANLLNPIVIENMQDILISAPSAMWAFLGFDIESTNGSLYHILVLDNSHSQPDGTATKEGIYVYADRTVELSGNATWKHQQPSYSSLWLPYETEISSTYENLVLSSGWNIVCMERSFEYINEDLQKVYYTYSNKSTSDCKWKLIVHDFSEH